MSLHLEKEAKDRLKNQQSSIRDLLRKVILLREITSFQTDLIFP